MSYLKNFARIGSIKGFTLIELLVVVLIIGILAAIAVPQYTKAVEKARTREAVLMVKAIGQAVERGFLATGEYEVNLNNLDIEAKQTTKNFSYSIAADAVMHVLAYNANKRYEIIYFSDWPEYPEYSNKIVCRANSGNEEAVSWCKAIGTSLQDYRFNGVQKISFIN